MSRFATVDQLPDPTPDDLATAIAAAAGGTIYFIQAGDNGPIKIGYTRRDRLKTRLSSLQTGNPAALNVRRVVSGTRDTERSLHQLYADLRIRGEWFYPDPDLIAVAAGPSL